MASLSQNCSAETKVRLSSFLEILGFRQAVDSTFSNGRASVRFDGNAMIATPAGGAAAWRTELSGANEEGIRYLLSQVLASPGFLSEMEIERRAARQSNACEALKFLASAVRENPEGHSGKEIRRLLWSLYNGHHELNLWRLKDVLDSQHNAAVVEAFVAWMEGFVPEVSLREALIFAGEPVL